MTNFNAQFAINECNWNREAKMKNEVRICLASSYKSKTDYFPIKINSHITQNGLVRHHLNVCSFFFVSLFSQGLSS